MAAKLSSYLMGTTQQARTFLNLYSILGFVYLKKHVLDKLNFYLYIVNSLQPQAQWADYTKRIAKKVTLYLQINVRIHTFSINKIKKLTLISETILSHKTHDAVESLPLDECNK